MKDIIVRYNLANIKEIQEIYQYLITNFAQKYSYNSLSKFINISSISTISKYIQLLQDTYFGYNIGKFDFSLKLQLRSKKKFYLHDHGFIPLLSMKLTKDTGWILENIVFVELLKQNNVFYYSNGFECDFIVVTKNSINMAIQVTLELNQNNRKREIDGLIKTMKKLKLRNGLILSDDQEDQIIQEEYTIFIKPIWKWLLEKKQRSVQK